MEFKIGNRVMVNISVLAVEGVDLGGVTEAPGKIFATPGGELCNVRLDEAVAGYSVFYNVNPNVLRAI